MVDQFKAARRAGVPLLGIITADPDKAITATATEAEAPTLVWDMVRGLRGLNDPGERLSQRLNGDMDPAMATANVVECLMALQKVTEDDNEPIIYMLNANRVLSDQQLGAAASQGIWNLRDKFKAIGASLVLMGQDISLPMELKDDVVVLRDPLPNEVQLDLIVGDTIEAFKEAAPDVELAEDITPIIDAVSGLPGFAAEQVTAMSLGKDGLNTETLWNRKSEMIEQTKGLSVWRGGETFADVGGCENVKTFFSLLLKGQSPPRCVMFIDEIEKGMAGSGGDTSGVSQDRLGTFLSWTQNAGVMGAILVGPPGSGKSMVAKSVGATGGIPTIQADFNATSGSLVGESEASFRRMLATVDAVGRGSVLVVATCNSIAILPPELRRRFNLGTFYFDLPTHEEQMAIWDHYIDKYKLRKPEGAMTFDFDTKDWTGAEVKQCCEIAWRLSCDIGDASSYIVPVAKAAAEQIEALRTQANGRYISAAYPGPYKKDKQAKGRKMRT